MKILSKYLTKYNTGNSILVLTTYPRKGHLIDPKALAVAPVAKNTLNAISEESHKQNNPIKFIVIADALEGEDVYEEDNHLVIRCWTRNQFDVYARVQAIANLFPKAKTIVIEHEFGIFGLKNSITAQFPFFLLLNRLLGRRVVLILHQVIFDLGELSGHLHLSATSFKTKLLSALIRVNYFLFGLLANHSVVFDEHLRTKLAKYVNIKNITALPHPNTGKPIKGTKQALKKELGLDPEAFYIMFCGYVTWYKGADWLVRNFKLIAKHIKAGKKVRLLVAGGKSSSLEIDPKYLRWYNKLESTIGKSRVMDITGVLTEKDYPKYIAAADLMVMPYRLMMSSSGPFSYAQRAGTPVIISEKLEPMTHAFDFQESLKEANLNAQDLVFNLNSQSLLNRINTVIKTPGLLKRMGHFTKILGTKRSDQVQASYYLSIFKNAKLYSWPSAISPSSSIASR